MMSMALMLVMLLAPLLAAGFDPGAEWVPGMSRSGPPLPPLPPRDPDAEVVGPVVDPRPMIDGNYPVDRNHKFASFFVNDKPQLPPNYDRQLADEGLTPEQRRYGEHPPRRRYPQAYGPQPSRLTAPRLVREHHPPRRPPTPEHLPSQRPFPAEVPPTRTHLPNQRPFPAEMPPTWEHLPSQRPLPVEVPPPRPPLPTGHQQVRAPGQIRLQNGYTLHLVPVDEPQPARDEWPTGRQGLYPAVQEIPAPPVDHLVPTRRRASRPHRHPAAAAAAARSTRKNEVGVAGDPSLPPVPDWPNLEDPAAIERYHRRVEQHMDRLLRGSSSLPPAGLLQSVAARPDPATVRPGEVLVEHRRRSSDKPYLRESYKVFHTPTGQRTTYSKHTKYSYSSRSGRPRRAVEALGARARPFADRPLLKRLRPATLVAGDRLTQLPRIRREVLNATADLLWRAVTRLREGAETLAAAVQDTLPSRVTDAVGRAAEALANISSDAYDKGEQVAADGGHLLSQVPSAVSGAGTAISQAASAAYESLAESRVAQSLSQIDGAAVVGQAGPDALSDAYQSSAANDAAADPILVRADNVTDNATADAGESLSQIASSVYEVAAEQAAKAGPLLTSGGDFAADVANAAGERVSDAAGSVYDAAREQIDSARDTLWRLDGALAGWIRKL